MADRILKSGRRRFSVELSPCGGGRRDWRQIYAVYGTGEAHTIAFLLVLAAVFAAMSLLLLVYFSLALELLDRIRPRSVATRFLLGSAGSLAAFFSACLVFAAGSVLHSSLALHWEMAQRMVQAVPDWSAVRSVLDVGCGRGMLLNAVAGRLEKERTSGRVVGLAPRRDQAVAALRRAWAEGVGDRVTCREGDARRLPFPDDYFDVVVSAVHLSEMAAPERARGLGELVRVLKPGGTGVVWDLALGPEYAHRLREMRMDEVRVSDPVTAYLVTSHIVSFRKPAAAGGATEWRATIAL
ncbi:sterol 24-C-methyltransferase ERG6B-like [Wolffia australiana]